MFASTDDVELTSVYASVDEDDRSRVTLVLINRSDDPVDARIELKHREPLSQVVAYRFTAAAPKIQRVDAVMAAPNAIDHALPPMSATVMRLNVR